MLKIKLALISIIIAIFPLCSIAQETESKPDTIAFSGAMGFTNNGFSIIPSFSLNSPAVLLQLKWKKKKFSIDPDIRLSPDGRKGSMIYWLRYYPLQKNKFSLRMGIHPSFLLQIREITENGDTYEISRMSRFIAWEFVPNYQLTRNWGIGFYYLNGNGLQNYGTQTSHFVNLNMSISNIKLGDNLRLTLIPAVYYLNLDGYWGNYFTATTTLSHTKLPFSLQSIINQTFISDLPGNKDFIWNVSIFYNFNKRLVPATSAVLGF